jgi:hypothetical protein
MSRRPNSFVSLKEYTKQPMSAEEFKDFLAELSGSGHRAAALVAGAMLETDLTKVLKAQFAHLTESEINDLFGSSGPLYSFSNKIKFAYALRLISSQFRDDLDVLREIRNAFAHSQRPLNFEIQEIGAMCRRLKSMDIEKGYDLNDLDKVNVDNRTRYLACALHIAVAILKEHDEREKTAALVNALRARSESSPKK